MTGAKVWNSDQAGCDPIPRPRKIAKKKKKRKKERNCGHPSRENSDYILPFLDVVK